jgi:transcriptional regulator with XRE-family HTH domain
MTLAHNLVAVRNQIGMSQRTLAAQTGLARNYLTCIERGQANPSLGVLACLSLVVGKRPHELITPPLAPSPEEPLKT